MARQGQAEVVFRKIGDTAEGRAACSKSTNLVGLLTVLITRLGRL